MKKFLAQFTFAILFCILFLTSCMINKVRITDMRTEYQKNPISIDSSPRFSWNYKANYSFTQKSYFISVAKSKSQLGKGYSTPLIMSKEMHSEALTDLELQSNTHYYWQVTTYNPVNGRQIKSPIGEFTTAMLSPSDWTAKWISDSKGKDATSMPLFQKDFSVIDDIASAKLYVSAAAYAMVSVNGKRLSTAGMNPGYTHYDKRNLYMTYDVTDKLTKGTNSVQAVLGNGFYNEIEKNGVWNFEKARWRDRPRMICEIHIELKNGTKQIIKTDSSWKTTTDGSFVRNNIYSGDTYDTRKNLSQAKWESAKEVEAPSKLLKAQQMGGIEIDSVYKAKSMRSFGDSVYVYDFGTNMSGYCQLKIKGEKNTRVTIQHGELLKKDGRLEMRNIDIYYYRQPGLECQTDVYYLNGEENILRPDFTYHGFRYVEVKADKPITITKDDAEALFIHTDMERVGSFACSDTTLNKLWQMVNQSYLCNFMSIPTDCPQREKNGWTADAHISSDIGLLNFNSINAYEKWMDDIIDNQDSEGRITGIIPSSGWGNDLGPVWDGVAFVLPMQIYSYYGEKKYVERMLPVCERYLAYLNTRETSEGIINYGLGDWVPYKTQTPNDFTSTCFYYLENLYVAKFRTILGKDATLYTEKAEKLKAVINSKFFDSDKQLYSNGSESAQALALWLGIVPKESEKAVASNLSQLIKKDNNHLDFGMLGSKTVLRMLCKYGYADQAVDMALKKDAPSWANWIECGYTTPIETWVLSPEFRDASANHVFLGDINAWMYNYIAGINYDVEKPGFKHIIFSPCFPKQLTWAKATYKSPAGQIMSSWKREGDNIVLDVTIPVNTTATIIAGDTKKEVQAGNHQFTFPFTSVVK